ncbi:MAG: hypothetical protein H0U49_00650 [Parachlamydiaceae bacterium]|nr:hypothetical protein [Parachlamydiaceae bacterium]
MDDSFKIFIEQLRDGRTEEIEESHSPDFLDINEDELKFKRDVLFEGQAYLADDNLLIHLKIETFATVPCSICNNPVEVKIEIPNFYHMEPVAEIKTGTFDFAEVLREAILLEVPRFAECGNGQCPEREKIAKFLREKPEADDLGNDDGYQPFANIDLDKYKPTT